MVRCWIFSLKNKGNIQGASERLVWRFWDRDLAKSRKSKFARKLVRNWRSFLKLYNSITTGDLVLFQIAGTGEIYALGIVKDRYHDDETPIWDVELKENNVLFPWRVSFYTVIYSEDPFTRHYIALQNYVDGYGIGEVPLHEVRAILDKIKKDKHINISIHI